MAHWIKLPGGGYLNADTLTGVGPQTALLSEAGHARSYSTQAGFNGRVENAAADVLARAIEVRIAHQELVGPLAADDDFTEEDIAKMVSEFPQRHRSKPQGPPLSMEAARLMAQGEERALKAVAAYLASTGVDDDGIHHFVGGVRWGLGGNTGTYEGADATLPDVEPLGSGEEFPGIRQLDLRMGDDVLVLRYGGVDYVAAIKFRFGDGVEGFSDRYLEVAAFNPHTRMWTLVERADNVGKTDTRFVYALGVAVRHDRAAFLEG